MSKRIGKIGIFLIIISIFLIGMFSYLFLYLLNILSISSNEFNILSSFDNKYMEKYVIDYGKKNNINIKFEFMGDLDIIDELNNNKDKYDSVWISNSMWFYMLNNPYMASNTKSISISPIVFGIKETKAKELGLTSRDITNKDIVELIKNKKINYAIGSVTRTNEGASAYLGFLNSLLNNPEVLTKEMLDNEELKTDLTTLFSGVERVSGSKDYLEDMFIKSSNIDAVFTSEASLININKQLEKDNREQLYLIYPTDGVSISDSQFGFLGNDDKKDDYLKIQKYLLSNDAKKVLEENGMRTWYGGISNSNNKIFKKKWGIDTTKYLNTIKYPSKDVITDAINLYIEVLRKPSHIVFCLDYSGSMYGDGEEELKDAMDYILNKDKASVDKLQFSKKDKITIITFSSDVNNIWTTNNGEDTNTLINNIKNEVPGGSTALYDAVEKGLDILRKEDDTYTKTVIALTDGQINVGSFYNLKNKYNKYKLKIPVYSITFGSADYNQLDNIADLTNAKVFDGKENLLGAFKEVRGYN